MIYIDESVVDVDDEVAIINDITFLFIELGLAGFEYQKPSK